MISNQILLFGGILGGLVLTVFVLVLIALRNKLRYAARRIHKLESEVKNLYATVDVNFERLKKSNETTGRTFWILQRIFTQLAGQILTPLPDNGLINLSDQKRKEKLCHHLFEISESIGGGTISNEVALKFALQGKDIIVNSEEPVPFVEEEPKDPSVFVIDDFPTPVFKT